MMKIENVEQTYMKACDISVIIPVYNAEKYLGNCIESVLRQTKNNIEIIIVNDGSTDETAEIIKKYADQNNNITVITQENGGLKKAREAGIREARGEFVGWVDADDFISNKMYETLYELARREDADFVYCDYEFYPRKIATKSRWFKEYRGIVDGDFIDRNTQFWNKLVKRELYERIHLEELLPEFSEYSMIAAMLAAKKISYTNEALYYYRVGHESMSAGAFEGRVPHFKNGVNTTRNLKRMIKDTPFEKSLDTYFDYRYIYTLLLLLMVAAKNGDKEAYKEAQAELKRLRFRKNPYLDKFVGHNYGKLRAWAITRVVPSCYTIARPIMNIAI